MRPRSHFQTSSPKYLSACRKNHRRRQEWRKSCIFGRIFTASTNGAELFTPRQLLALGTFVKWTQGSKTENCPTRLSN